MQSPGGSGTTDLQFRSRKPDGDSIRGQASGVEQASKHFEELEKSITAEHKKARAGINGEPSRHMAGADHKPIQKTQDLQLWAMVAAGALTNFADAVDEFNAEVAGWNAEITEALDDGKDDRAKEIRRGHEEEYQERPVIKEAADQAAQQLKNADDEDTLKQLWKAGALPASAKGMFPDIGLKNADIDTQAGVDSLINQMINDKVLPPKAADWDAAQMRKWLKNHPAKAEDLADQAPSGKAAGIESLLAGLVPPQGSDENQQQRNKRMGKTRKFFESLDGDDAAKLAMLFSKQTGNLNGVPFINRAQANTVNVAAADHEIQRKINKLKGDIDDERQDADRVNASQKAKNILALQAQISGYEDRKDVYDSILDENRQILLFDSAGDGKIAEIHGSIDKDTQNVGTLVPGITNEMNNFDTTRNRAKAFQDGDQSGELTMISWLGGDMPDGIFSGATSSGHYQDGMAQNLADFSQAVRQEIDHSNAAGNNVDTTYAGHSYGGATVGAAEKHGLAADNVLHMSSAGLSDGIDSPDDLPDSQDDVNRYSITPDNDTLMNWSRPFLHGGNPDNELTRLESGDYRLHDEASGHGGTLDERGSMAWKNALKVLTGRGDQAGEYDPEKHSPGGEYGPPNLYGPTPYPHW